ncbi:sulfatase-like hydrolase/transferase [Carboxylicivirga sp. N1Y132]|uniref:Sulfatase-like hydrolase/transferase n=1 Tax=Carboxylicivirga marina TaxID=2800988 RepID=A0ABS1HP45_9BACT|nr:sulfatase-like hydrolase/transferase [Carboxylicivirga marina]
MDKFDELGVADNTIFIFTADNGPEGLNAGSTNFTVETTVHGFAGPWKATLFAGFEGALRVPFAIRWPGKINRSKLKIQSVSTNDCSSESFIEC